MNEDLLARRHEHTQVGVRLDPRTGASHSNLTSCPAPVAIVTEHTVIVDPLGGTPAITERRIHHVASGERHGECGVPVMGQRPDLERGRVLACAHHLDHHRRPRPGLDANLSGQIEHLDLVSRQGEPFPPLRPRLAGRSDRECREDDHARQAEARTHARALNLHKASAVGPGPERGRRPSEGPL